MRSWMAAAKRFTAPSPKKTKLFSRRVLGSRIGLEPLEERAMLAVFHVALSGNDGNDGSAATPYRTIQQAITAASAADDGDDIIRVAGGTYNTVGVDLGITINADAELDTLDIVGSFDATFSTNDVNATPTTYMPQGGGGQVSVLDADVTFETIAFVFDGTASGIVLGAGNFSLNTVLVTGAVDGITGDSLSDNVSITDSEITANSGTGVLLTNMTGDLGMFGSIVSDNGANGVDFEGSGGAFVSIQTTAITGQTNGVGARVANPGGQVSFGNNSSVTLNGSGIVVNGASQLNIDATTVDSNTLNGLTASNVTGVVSLTGSSSFSTNGFIGASISNVGSFDVNNIDADDNSAGGVIVANVTGLSEITNSDFGGNSTGLGIDGSNGVTIGNVTANGNTTANGLTINNGGAVVVSSSSFNTNAAIGIEIKNSGSVTLSTVTVDENVGDGISLTTVAAVILTEVTATDNLNGLVVTEAASVTDSSLSTYSSNEASGVVLTDIGAGGVSFTGTTANSNVGDGFFANDVGGAVDFVGGSYSSNGGDGIHVELAGAITFNGDASGNGDDGIHVDDVASMELQFSTTASDNVNGAGLKALNVTGAVTVVAALNSNNIGLIVNTAASVNIPSADLLTNTLNGADIENVTGLVEINDTVANGNQFHGVSIATAGSVKVTGSLFNTNSAAGLLISDVTGEVQVESVTANNNSSGIGIDGANKVTILNVSAQDSASGSGLVLNDISLLGQSVNISLATFSNNAGDGIRITNTPGEVVLDVVDASGNGEEGFDIDGAEQVELVDLTLKNNVSGVGGKIDNVGQIRFVGTFLGVVADLIEITGTSITHTRAGDAQQVINYTDDTFRLTVSGHEGDDTIRLTGAFTLGAGDGFTAFGNEGEDLIEANGVKGFGGTVPLLLNGGDGTDTLTVNTLSGFDDLLELTSGFVTVKYGPNAQAATAEVHEYDSVEEISLNSAGGNDSVVITEPANGIFPGVVNVNGGDENDGIEINLGKPDTDTLYNILGGAGVNGLTIFTRSANDNTISFFANLVTVAPRDPNHLATLKSISFGDEIRGINVYADAGNDRFDIGSSSLGLGLERVSLFGQGDNDLVDMDLSHPALAFLVQFDGGAGVDNRLMIDTASGDSDFVEIDSQRVRTQLGASTNPNKDVDYTNVQLLFVDTGSGDDQVSLAQASAAPTLPALVVLDLEGGTDVVNVDVANIPNSVELSLFLGGGDDTVNVTLAATDMQTTLNIDGGGQDLQDEIRVIGNSVAANNLSVGSTSSEDRIRAGDIELLFMIGGAGADVFTNNTSTPSILDGLGGNDSLTGGDGRDFILGEGGLDELSSLEGDDLLVSGPVSFDLHVASLFAIMAEWTSGRTFAERVANINGTGVGPRENGDVFLQPTVTVFDEGALDLLTGGLNDDWFLAQTSNDQVLDLQNLDDIVTVIP